MNAPQAGHVNVSDGSIADRRWRLVVVGGVRRRSRAEARVLRDRADRRGCDGCDGRPGDHGSRESGRGDESGDGCDDLADLGHSLAPHGFHAMTGAACWVRPGVRDWARSTHTPCRGEAYGPVRGMAGSSDTTTRTARRWSQEGQGPPAAGPMAAGNGRAAPAPPPARPAPGPPA